MSAERRCPQRYRTSSPCRRWPRSPSSSCAFSAAQQRRKRLAPALDRVSADRLKIFLEGQPALFAGTAGSDDLRNRFDDRKHEHRVNGFSSEMYGLKPQAITEQVLVSPCSTGILATIAWDGVSWVLAAVRHQHGARADGRVEPLGQAAAASRRLGPP